MLKPWYFGPLKGRADSMEKTLMLGKIEGKRRRRRQRMRWLDIMSWLNGHEFEQTLWDSEGWACCTPWRHKELDTTWWLNSNNIFLQLWNLHIYGSCFQREYYYHQRQQGSHYVLGFKCCLITLGSSTMPEDENEMKRNLYPCRNDFLLSSIGDRAPIP